MKLTNLIISSCVLVLSTILNLNSQAQLSAGFTANNLTGCSPLLVNFTDQTTSNPTNWKWDLGNGTTSTLQNPSVVYINPGQYSVKLITRNSRGIDSIIKNQYITVYAKPTVRMSASVYNGCSPTTITFLDLSNANNGSIISWKWDLGDGSFSNQVNPTHTYTSSGNFNVSLQVTNSFGCIESLTQTNFIYINEKPTASFTNGPVSSCNVPFRVNFQNSSSSNSTNSFLWNFGDGSTSTEENPFHIYTIPGTYTVQLIITSAQGCVDTIIKPDLVSIANTRTMFTAPDSICVNTPAQIINTSTTTQASWDFGDNTTSDALNLVKTYTAAGTYQIKLVNNFGSCIDSLIKPIVVLANPVVDFIANNLNSCQSPLAVNFSNTSINANTYQWSFGDTNTSTEMNPIHTYSMQGSYAVSLISTNTFGCSNSVTKSQYINIKYPVVTVSQMPKRGCAPLICDFIATVVGGDSVVSYLWDLGDGNTSNIKNPTHTYDQGVYDISLIIVTASGCTDTVTYRKGVKAGSKPHPNFSATPTDACANTPIVFTNLTPASDSADQWLWSFGDGTSSTSQNPQHIYIDSGYLNVQLVAYNNGCPDTLIIENYIHILAPIANFTTIKNCADRRVKTFVNKSIGADTWEWNFGDGSTSTDLNPVHTYANNGAYTVKLEVRNAFGCYYIKTSVIYVIDEHADFIASDTSICKGSSTKFEVTGGITPTYFSNFSWDFGDIITGTGTPITKTYFISGIYTIKLIATDRNGCKDTIIKNNYIKVNGPKANFNATLTNLCTLTYCNFIDTSISDGRNAIVQWIWNYGDGHLDTMSNGNTSNLYYNSGSYTVTLTVTDSKGCSNQLSKSNFITVSQPTAKFITPDTIGCPNSSIRFLNQSTGTNLIYAWYFGDGTTSTLQNPVHKFLSNGNYTIKLIVTSPLGCRDSMAKTSYINIVTPIAHFEVSDSVGTCPPLIVTFTNTSVNYISQVWNFGDGTSTNTDNPSHFYSISGTHFAKLTVTSNGGCTSVFQKKIVVKGPTGTISYGGLIGCAPMAVNFNAITHGTNSIVWDYSDGNTNITPDTFATHTYLHAGLYVPKVILRDTAGCSLSMLGKDTIKVHDISASFSLSANKLCDGGIINFTNTSTSTETIASYNWDLGDNSHSALLNPSHNYTINGNFEPKLVVHSLHGCADSISSPLPIVISTTPQARVTQTANGCAGVTINFNGLLIVADTSTLTWNWNFGNGNISNLKTPTAQVYNIAGIHPVTLIVSNRDGCKDTVKTSVEAYAIPAVNAGIDTFVCKGRGVSLNATGASMYNWTPSIGLNCTTCASPRANPDSALRYYVTGTTVHGCSMTDSVSIVVKYPFIMTSSKRDTICVGSSQRLFATGAEKYTWTPSLGLDNPIAASPLATPSATTNYMVIGTDDKHCFSDTAIVPIIVFNIPTVEAGDDKTINVGQSIELIPQISSDVTEAKWSPTSSLMRSSFPGITVKPKETTTFKVEVKNNGGCSATDQLTVNVLCDGANLFIPNTFSPNQDGSNDIFYPRGTGIFSIKRIKVFSRWGEVIYEKNNIKANDPSTGWDGTFKGKKLNPDVYVYIVEVSCDNNTVLTFKGNVALIK